MTTAPLFVFDHRNAVETVSEAPPVTIRYAPKHLYHVLLGDDAISRCAVTADELQSIISTEGER